MNLEFKNYCVMFMGVFDAKEVKDLITGYSEKSANFVDAKGVMICTFTSAFTIKEIEYGLKTFGVNFFAFELNRETSAYHIIKKDIHDGLFSFVDKIKLSDISKDLREQILSSQSTLKNKDVIYVKPEKTSLTIDDVKKMSKKEKENLWNKIIDNGVENMSEEDKIILKFLSE